MHKYKKIQRLQSLVQFKQIADTYLHHFNLWPLFVHPKLWIIVCKHSILGYKQLAMVSTLSRWVYRRVCTTAICGLFTFTSAFAQYNGYQSLDDLRLFKKQFEVETKKIQTIKSNFFQEKNLAMLEEKISSEGKFYFKRENKVRITYEKPFQYLMIINGDQMLVKDNQKENKINVKSNKLFQQVNKIMVDCVQGTMLDNKDFNVRVFQNEKNWLLEMTPINKTLKEFFKVILIHADKKDYSVSSIDMREPSGDNTIIKFTQKELNVTLQDALFAIK